MSALQLPQGFYGPRRDGGDLVRPHALRGGIASGYAANVGIGDPVKLVTAGTYELTAATETTTAIFAGWNPEDASVYEKLYWASGTTYVKVPVFFFYPVNDVIWSVASAGVVAQTAIGDAADHIAGTLNTNSGKSGAYLATAALAGAAASAEWKIVGLRPEPGNNWGDAYVQLEVMLNEPNLGRSVGNAI